MKIDMQGFLMEPVPREVGTVKCFILKKRVREPIFWFALSVAVSLAMAAAVVVVVVLVVVKAMTVFTNHGLVLITTYQRDSPLRKLTYALRRKQEAKQQSSRVNVGHACKHRADLNFRTDYACGGTFSRPRRHQFVLLFLSVGNSIYLRCSFAGITDACTPLDRCPWPLLSETLVIAANRRKTSVHALHGGKM